MKQGQKVNLHFIIDGEIKQLIRLEFIGHCNQWLHFIDLKTRKNHLCPPDQFPLHRYKTRESIQTFQYELQ